MMEGGRNLLYKDRCVIFLLAVAQMNWLLATHRSQPRTPHPRLTSTKSSLLLKDKKGMGSSRPPLAASAPRWQHPHAYLLPEGILDSSSGSSPWGWLLCVYLELVFKDRVLTRLWEKNSPVGRAKGRHQSHHLPRVREAGSPCCCQARSAAAVVLRKLSGGFPCPRGFLPVALRCCSQELPVSPLPEGLRRSGTAADKAPSITPLLQMSSEMRCNSRLSPAPSITGAEY